VKDTVKVDVTEGEGFTVVGVHLTGEETLVIRSSGSIVSWGPRAETDQRPFLEMLVAFRKPVVIIATEDDLPPLKWLERFNMLCPVIVYDEHLEGDKQRAVNEAKAVVDRITGGGPKAWIHKG